QRPLWQHRQPLLDVVRREVEKEDNQSDGPEARTDRNEKKLDYLGHSRSRRALRYWRRAFEHSGLSQTSLIDPPSGKRECRLSHVTTSPQNLQRSSPFANAAASPNASR